MQKLLLSAAVLVLIGAGCAANVDTGAEADVSGAAGTQPAGQGGDFDDTPEQGTEGLGASADIDAEAEGAGADADAEASAAADATAEDDAAMNDDTVVITYDGSRFDPADLSVTAGTTVIFRNESNSAFWPASDVHPVHSQYAGTTMSEHCASAAAAFDACGRIESGNAFSFTFDRVGTWSYHNHLRATQGGTITVTQ